MRMRTKIFEANLREDWGDRMGESDQFNGRLDLIFASIGAAIGTGSIWRFPRMVGANGGGTFLIPSG